MVTSGVWWIKLLVKNGGVKLTYFSIDSCNHSTSHFHTELIADVRVLLIGKGFDGGEDEQ
jgi:hypothetical protein